VAFGQPQRGGAPRERRGPPPSAYESCQGAQEGSSCSFSTPRGARSGACYDIGGRLACTPDDAPRPPSREPSPNLAPGLEASQLAEPLLAPQLEKSAKLSEPLAAALTASLRAEQAQPEKPEPPKPAPSGFPWLGLFAGLGGAAGIFALWKTSSASDAAPAVSTPTIRASRGTPIPALEDPAPAAIAGSGPNGGRLIGKDYELRKEIGVGGMGVVYEALDLKLDRRVALKKMRPEISKNPRGRDRFLSEAKLVAKLQHPNIVTIHGIVEDHDDLYIVFEYVDGETLDALLGRNTRLTAEQALSVLRGAADAVDYAHEHKIIHRDLKPANIMIDKSGHAKVMDFGIAHQAKLTISQFTVAEAFGTLAYMPPEQELGKAVRESDVYAFAALTYESLSGVLPFPGPNFHLQKEAMSFTRPSFNYPPLSARLDPVFERAFQVDPKKRFATTGEFVRTVQAALASPA
jgi:predicted Ser/Thr protein kinase